MRSLSLLLVSFLAACSGKEDDTATAAIDRDADGYDTTVDCDDGDPEIHPDAVEAWYDGVDRDCDGADDFDQDGDGVRGAAVAGDGLDCDDLDASVYPGNVERCDEVDNDCDQVVDEDAVDALDQFTDADADGWGTGALLGRACALPEGMASVAGDCDDAQADISPDGLEVCDGVDNDCSGRVDDDALDAAEWHADLDGDGRGDAGTLARACAQPEAWSADASDCDDSDAATFPGAAELCDGRDNDCDGTSDEEAGDARFWFRDADADGFGVASDVVARCEQPGGYAATANDCDDADASVKPGADELCNSRDDDCDGTSDEDAVDAPVYHPDADADRFGDASVSVRSCSTVVGWVEDGTDCDDANSAAFPGASEVCGGGDEDCDGTVDESDAAGTSLFYVDGDGDGYGSASAATSACSAPRGYVAIATDCDDTVAVANPGAREQCDLVDNDCDGQVDEEDAYDVRSWYVDGDRDGYGDATVDLVACSPPAGFVASPADCDDDDPAIAPSVAETRDLVDQDCDGLVDEDFISTGDVVVTELARQPYVGGTGTSANPNAQWFELHNTSAFAIDLSGWYVEEELGDFFYVAQDSGIVIPAGGYVTFCYGVSGLGTPSVCSYRWGDPANGENAYGLLQYDTTFYFDRDEDLIGLYVDGLLIDEVFWSLSDPTGVAWPRTAHYSMRLDDDHLDATDNDLPSSWCLSSPTQVYSSPGARGGPDFGTPSAANGSCD